MGEYLIQQTKEYIDREYSPLASNGPGTGKFKTLSSDYAEVKKKIAGNDRADLYLYGDMQGALDFVPTEDGIEYGIFEQDEAQKADNHNKFSFESYLTGVPPRRFIPNEDMDDRFNSKIENGVANIVNEVRLKYEREEVEEPVRRGKLTREQIESIISDVKTRHGIMEIGRA